MPKSKEGLLDCFITALGKIVTIYFFIYLDLYWLNYFYMDHLPCSVGNIKLPPYHAIMTGRPELPELPEKLELGLASFMNRQYKEKS